MRLLRTPYFSGLIYSYSTPDAVRLSVQQACRIGAKDPVDGAHRETAVPDGAGVYLIGAGDETAQD